MTQLYRFNKILSSLSNEKGYYDYKTQTGTFLSIKRAYVPNIFTGRIDAQYSLSGAQYADGRVIATVRLFDFLTNEQMLTLLMLIHTGKCVLG